MNSTDFEPRSRTSPYASCRCGRLGGGFTLVELLITITIAAILMAVAVPSFLNVTLGSRLNTAANNFVASTHLARSEAIKRNVPVTLCASSNGTSCVGNWRDGWIVLAGGTRLQVQQALPDGLLLVGNVNTLNFQPAGVGATITNLTLCRSAPSVGSQQRAIAVTATGRPSVTKVSNTTACP